MLHQWAVGGLDQICPQLANRREQGWQHLLDLMTVSVRG
jgi:hypothetical protein